jgi:hypothetical protein
MIDHDEAKQSVLRYISTVKSVDRSEWVIVDEMTEEHEAAWLFVSVHGHRHSH